MKRPRAANGRKADQIQNTNPIRANGRDLKTIEPNGDADEVRRSSRLKTTVPGKVVSKVCLLVRQAVNHSPHEIVERNDPNLQLHPLVSR